MLKGFAHNFRPMKRGLGRALGDLEKDIMNILWVKGESTGKDDVTETNSSPHSLPYCVTRIVCVFYFADESAA
ncbi:MAG: hypothetical protein HY266_00955 [Deltaproteobacteria bacterium]|nr:hypothetical protein [Deltaproteobacteria bacterium]